MQARLVGFGRLELEGRRYNEDVVIERGRVRKRHKKPSRRYRDAYGHTPLSLAERIPWGGRSLIVGTGAEGALPITPDVLAEGRRRRVEIMALPTDQACELLRSIHRRDVHAILHVTC